MRDEIIRLLREDFDPRPNPELYKGEWDDNAEDVADRIIALMKSSNDCEHQWHDNLDGTQTCKVCLISEKQDERTGSKIIKEIRIFCKDNVWIFVARFDDGVERSLECHGMLRNAPAVDMALPVDKVYRLGRYFMRDFTGEFETDQMKMIASLNGGTDERT